MKTFQAKLTSKAQVTLPLKIRKSLGVGPGDGIEFFLHRTGEVFVLPRRPRRYSAKVRPTRGRSAARRATASSAKQSPRAARGRSCRR
jgi:AbrB family looped-hinge helix DNA binding protein